MLHEILDLVRQLVRLYQYWSKPYNMLQKRMGMNNPYKANVYRVRFNASPVQTEIDRDILYYRQIILRDQEYLKAMRGQMP